MEELSKLVQLSQQKQVTVSKPGAAMTVRVTPISPVAQQRISEGLKAGKAMSKPK